MLINIYRIDKISSPIGHLHTVAVAGGKSQILKRIKQFNSTFLHCHLLQRSQLKRCHNLVPNEVNLKQNFYFEEQSCTLNITEKMSLKLLY